MIEALTTGMKWAMIFGGFVLGLVIMTWGVGIVFGILGL